jgi:hypothetical protein
MEQFICSPDLFDFQNKAGFPMIGKKVSNGWKSRAEFSNGWKIFFQWLEKMAEIFQ